MADLLPESPKLKTLGSFSDYVKQQKASGAAKALKMKPNDPPHIRGQANRIHNALVSPKLKLRSDFDIQQVVDVIWKHAQASPALPASIDDVSDKKLETIYGSMQQNAIELAAELSALLNEATGGAYAKADPITKAGFITMLSDYIGYHVNLAEESGESDYFGNNFGFLLRQALCECMAHHAALNLKKGYNRKVVGNTILFAESLFSSFKRRADEIDDRLNPRQAEMLQTIQSWLVGMKQFLTPFTKFVDSVEVTDRLFSSTELMATEDWQALGDLYAEACDSPDRGIAHANIFLRADELGLKEDAIIVLSLLPDEDTNYPISGALFPLKNFKKTDEKADTMRDSVKDDGAVSRRYVFGSVKFYVHAGNHISVDHHMFTDPEVNRGLLGDNYERLRAYIFYALAAETNVNYEIAPPKEFRQINTKPTPSAPNIDHIPYPPRKVTLVKGKDEAKHIYDSFMPAGRVEHTRLLKEGWTPSETAYEISRSPAHNPQNVKLNAAIIDLESRTIQLVPVEGGGSYPVFLREFERIKEVNQVAGKVVVRCQTFVRRTVKAEEVAGRAAVLSTAGLAGLGTKQD